MTITQKTLKDDKNLPKLSLKSKMNVNVNIEEIHISINKYLFKQVSSIGTAITPPTKKMKGYYNTK